MVKYSHLWFSLLFCVISTTNLSSQNTKTVYENNTGWLAYIGTWKLTPKWTLLPEIQLRRDDVVKFPMQTLVRLGLSRSLTSNVSVAGGYMYAWTSVYGDLPARAAFPENRAWEQLQVNYPLGSVETLTRFRLEHRWVNAPVSTGTSFEPGDAVYTNRIRFMHRFNVPLTAKTITDKSLYATAFNELFINFGKNVALNTFDQNRIFVGLGYKVPKFGRVELGYINQRVMRGDGKSIEQNHTLSIWLLNSLNLQKSNK